MTPNQGWDFLSITLSGTVVLVVILGVPIANLIRDKLHARQRDLAPIGWVGTIKPSGFMTPWTPPAASAVWRY